MSSERSNLKIPFKQATWKKAIHPQPADAFNCEPLTIRIDSSWNRYQHKFRTETQGMNPSYGKNGSQLPVSLKTPFKFRYVRSDFLRIRTCVRIEEAKFGFRRDFRRSSQCRWKYSNKYIGWGDLEETTPNLKTVVLNRGLSYLICWRVFWAWSQVAVQEKDEGELQGKKNICIPRLYFWSSQ